MLLLVVVLVEVLVLDKKNYITGTVENVIYQNDDNGYTVFNLIVEEDDDEVVATGYIDRLLEGETLNLTGSFVTHHTYGRQFQVLEYEKTLPSSLIGIEKYLGSGLIKGIGKSLAKRIVKTFGEDTLSIIENTPLALADIKGITKVKAQEIGAVFSEQIESRQTMIYLQTFSITPVVAMKIYKKYKKETVNVLKENPYKLADDINGVSFKLCDSIAKNIGIDNFSPFRISSGIKYVLNRAVLKGHTYMPLDELINETSTLLEVDHNIISDETEKIVHENVIKIKEIDNELKVYLNQFFYAENYIAKKLIDLSLNYGDEDELASKKIEKAEKEIGISLHDIQKKAVKEALSSGVLVITGGPGTGKTTTINTIISILEEDGYDVLLAAPTGRAAKRMCEATGREAKTIHRLLEITFMEDDMNRGFMKNEDEPLETDVIILDESSMIDCMLMYSFLKAVAIGTRVILVGDANQLPSVGAGNVLKDIINSKVIDTVSLHEIFRQAQESQIVLNAHKVNNGQYPILNSKDSDFYFVESRTYEECVRNIVGLVTKRLPKYKNCDGFYDIQVLTAMRKTEIGVTNLNIELQKVLNTKTDFKKEKKMPNFSFIEGDKVMQVKNNYNMVWKNINDRSDFGKGVFNGDEGILTEIDNRNECVKVLFDGYKECEYDFSNLDELELSYAITIHKSQGSEYKIVVIPVFNGPPMLMTRNLLYTGITRGRELVVIVGTKEYLERMVDNSREFNRYSSLDFYIKSLNEFYAEQE